MGFTPPSPKGRTIEHVAGNPSSIIARGEEITRLGRQMHDSADLLERVATRSLEDGSQKGQAIEKLRDSIGESYQTLRESGDLYEPVGPVITQYGDDLEIYQPLLNRSADDCEDLYVAYSTTPGNKDGSTEVDEGGPLGIGGTDEEEAANNRAKQQAYDRWLEEAERFDDYYDSWESAFEDAANGIGEEMSGAIEDSFWSDVVDVLKVVGTIVAIAAMFTGIGALITAGIVIGVLLTAATAMQIANGEADGLDLALAALSIIPVTKISNVAKAGGVTALQGGRAGFTSFLKGGTPQFSRSLSIADDSIIGAWRTGGITSVGKFLGTGSSRGLSGLFDDGLRGLGTSRTTFEQWSWAARATVVQGTANGAGTAASFNSWAGDLGLPNISTPRGLGAFV